MMIHWCNCCRNRTVARMIDELDLAAKIPINSTFVFTTQTVGPF